MTQFRADARETLLGKCCSDAETEKALPSGNSIGKLRRFLKTRRTWSDEEVSRLLASDRAKAKHELPWGFRASRLFALRPVKPEEEDLEGGPPIEGSLSEASFRFCYCERVAPFLRFLGLSYSEILERKLSFSIVKRAATAQTKQRPIVGRRRFNP